MLMVDGDSGNGVMGTVQRSEVEVHSLFSKCRAMALDFMVIPLCCSSSLLSMYRSLPTIRGDMIPLLATSASANVVLPTQQVTRSQ